ncbi:hypothetical protein HRbin12_01447 [bacterium HR12]|nr:hypothetical protein HRbin12_01447 [bacterium HR12]
MYSLSQNTALAAGPMPAPVPLNTTTGVPQVTPPSVERLTVTFPAATQKPPWPPTLPSWAMGATSCLASKAGAGSPLPLLAPIGTWPSIQVFPPSNEVKNPVGTIAWRAPVLLLNR